MAIIYSVYEDVVVELFGREGLENSSNRKQLLHEDELRLEPTQYSSHSAAFTFFAWEYHGILRPIVVSVSVCGYKVQEWVVFECEIISLNSSLPLHRYATKSSFFGHRNKTLYLFMKS